VAAEPFGPFRSELDPIERIAQLRCLRTLVHVFAPEKCKPNQFGGVRWTVSKSLEFAEQHQDSGSLWLALAEFDAMPSLTRRKILATFAYIHRPIYDRRRKGTTRNRNDDDRQDDRTGRAIGQTQASSPRT